MKSDSPAVPAVRAGNDNFGYPVHTCNARSRIGPEEEKILTEKKNTLTVFGSAHKIFFTTKNKELEKKDRSKKRKEKEKLIYAVKWKLSNFVSPEVYAGYASKGSQ